MNLTLLKTCLRLVNLILSEIFVIVNEVTHVSWSGILPSGRNIADKVNAVIEYADVNHIFKISFSSDDGV